jgi:hypothetical protein
MVKHANFLKQKPTKIGELQNVQFLLLLLFIFQPFIVINFYIFFCDIKSAIFFRGC